jgi:hypothetical protein
VRFDSYSFGAITIDGTTYEHDVVLEHGVVSKRKKRASRPLKGRYGHTPLSVEEPIPWGCSRLVVGTGASGSLPVMDEVIREAERRNVELVLLPTEQAIGVLRDADEATNAILHVTC